MALHVGLFGGTFDPPTNAHLLAAQRAKEVLELDQIWFIPAYQNPLKEGKGITDPAIRMELVAAAINDHPGFSLNTTELDHPGYSYTIETIRRITRDYPVYRFTLLMGADLFESFHRWKHPEEILESLSVAIIPRGGHVIQGEAMKWLDMVNILEIEPVTLSSTEVREKIRFGESVADLVDPVVLKIIEARGLYQS